MPALPIIEGQALASGQSAGSSGVLVRGVRGPDLLGMEKISGTVEDGGGLLDFDNSGGVAIGTGLAANPRARRRRPLTLITPRGAVTPIGTSPRVKAYPVVGDLHDRHVGIRLDLRLHAALRGAALLQQPRRGAGDRGLSRRPRPGRRTLRPLVEEAAKRPVFTTDWRKRNFTFFTALQVERNVMFLILALIVLVAALNIISGLIMLVKDKGHDIAILRTMGATQGAILRVFFITGASIGTVGTLIGLAIGTIMCLNIESLHRFVSWMTSTEMFTPELYFLSQLPAEMDPQRDGRDRRDGARALLPRDALPGLAGGAARSRRGAALRMSEGEIRVAEAERPSPAQTGLKAAARKSALALKASRAPTRPAPARSSC